jgi:hypothetical protein
MTATPRSLQGRLLVLTLGLVASVWLAAALLTWLDVRHELDELFDAHLAQAAALLVVQQAQGIDDTREIDAPTLHRYAPKVAFQVFHEGALALRSANARRCRWCRWARASRPAFARCPSKESTGACSPLTAPSAMCRCTSAR